MPVGCRQRLVLATVSVLFLSAVVSGSFWRP